jgi:hypothetical protein
MTSEGFRVMTLVALVATFLEKKLKLTHCVPKKYTILGTGCRDQLCIRLKELKFHTKFFNATDAIRRNLTQHYIEDLQ